MGEARRTALVLALLATALTFTVAHAAPAAADHGDGDVFLDPEGEVDGPQNLAEGPDGGLWFTSPLNDRIGRIDPDAADPASTIETFDATLDAPWDITTGPDGNLWFTATGGVGRITPEGVVTTFPHVDAQGGDIVAFGDDLWFTSTANDLLGEVTTAGVFTFHDDPGLQGPTGIVVGTFSHITIVGGTIRDPVFDVDVIPTIWFANTDADQVAYVSPDGAIQYADHAALDAPTDIVMDATNFDDGSVWFNSTGNAHQGRCSANNFQGLQCHVDAAPTGVTEVGPIAVHPTGDDVPWHPWSTDLATDSFVTRTHIGDGDVTVTPEGAEGITDLLVRDNQDLWFTSGANDGIGRVDIDGEKPTLTITGLEDGDEFLRTEQPTVEFSCVDPAGGSGVAECRASLDGAVLSGQVLPDTGIGDRLLRVWATDEWGNSTQVDLDHTVLPTSSCAGHPATAELAFGDPPNGGGVEPYVVVGTPGDDDVHLTSNPAIVCTGAGDDRVEGGIHRGSRLGPGNDVLTENARGQVDLGAGDDRANTAWGPLNVTGSVGADILRGSSGADHLDGGPGNDKLFGNEGFDRLHGREGRDVLDGGEDGDRLFGGGGNDVLFGRADPDVLDGGDGNDVLNGGPGQELCYGGPGTDRQAGCELKYGIP